jgi:hypothetical protein
MPFSCSITLHLPNQNSNRQRRRSLRCIIVLPVKRKPTDAVHITPALLRCVFNGFQSDLLKLRSRAVFFDDGKTLGTMNLISVDMLLKQADFLGSRFPAVMLVKSRNDFLAVSRNCDSRPMNIPASAACHFRVPNGCRAMMEIDYFVFFAYSESM